MDIIDKLTLSAAKEPRSELAAVVWEAIEHIQQLRLTDEERDAICQAVTAYDGNDDDEECARIAATLRGLLERMK